MGARRSLLNRPSIGVRLVGLDVDGTLLGAGTAVSPANRDAIRRCVEAGVDVALSTGRPPYGARTVLSQLGLAVDQLHIFFDGAAVCDADGGNAIFSRQPDRQTLLELLDSSERLRLPMEFYTAEHLYAERPSPGVAIQQERLGIEPVYTSLRALLGQERVIKAGMVIWGPDNNAALKALQTNFSDRLHFGVARSPLLPDGDFVNITADGVSKGVALEALATHLGLPPEATLAIGDSYNDLSLLRAAGTAVAMGNAVAELKAIAAAVTSNVDDDGVAAAIERYVLI